MRSTLLLSLVLVACGSDPNTTQMDAPGSNFPATINISGTASARGISGSTPVAGVTIAAYNVSDENTPVVMTTTDASGNYMLAIPTGGHPIDGFVKATIAGYVTTYLYPPAPLTADFAGASVNMLTTSNFGLLSTISQANQQPGKGVIAVEVLDGSTTAAMPVTGATVTSTPAGSPTRYTANGLPSATPTATSADGIAFLFNVAPGAVTVGATGTATFKSHAVKSFADQFTTTLVTP